MSSTPVVAIVGRPNVGKSTLFNRLVGRRQSIVHNQPGVTRDRIVADTEVGFREITLIDTGGLILGHDVLGMNDQVRLAIEESDLVVLVVDGKEGLTIADQTVWHEIRRSNRPAVLAINKADAKITQQNAVEFARLGIADSVEISAEHGTGTGDLGDLIASVLPGTSESDGAAVGVPIAVVGRPNVGKSSIVNQLVGSERVLVSPQAGTTRDPIDTHFQFEDKDYRLVDTAGIRRRSQVSDAPEGLAVMMARRQIEQCEVAILVVDGAQGVVSGDLGIAGAIWEKGKSAVVAVNKWDLVSGEVRERVDESYPRLDEILSGPERVNLSALTGRSIDKLFPAVVRAGEASKTQLSTSQVNSMFEKALERHHPPAIGDKPWRVYYATQVKTGPPTFMLFANRSLPRAASYRRYLENFVRSELALPGVPIRLVIRRKRDQ